MDIVYCYSIEFPNGFMGTISFSIKCINTYLQANLNL